MNAMIVDSQHSDRTGSSWMYWPRRSTVQVERCSALRVLCLQDEIADHTLKMLRGAIAECRMGHAVA
ncbi:hypothetical protein ACNKHT_06830 [Shigella flexneri]